MNVSLITGPTLEVLTLAEIKAQIILDSGTLADNTTLYASIAAGSHAVVTDYTLLGTAIDVLGHNAVVFLQPINNGASGTVDVKIQEADAAAGPWTDWTGGGFTQVTEATDTTIQEKQYTGTKQWIRTAAKTLVAACEFGTSILVWEPTSTEDDLLTADIEAARLYFEECAGRKLLTQTFDLFLDGFPAGDSIRIPFGNLQSVTHIKYTDSAGTETTLTETTDYIVELNGQGCGRIVLPYGVSWPSFTAYPSKPIVIRFICGWTARASVPSNIRKTIKMICADLYKERTSMQESTRPMIENRFVMNTIMNATLWWEF